jgi:DNA-binding response OmpR family regulator
MNKCIAVVEDELDILELVSVHLRKEHYDVKGYLNGSDFLKVLNSESFLLIVLDLMLPDVDGLEICRLIQSNPNHSTIPIIMLTARSGETDRVLGLELGADDYVVKPFSPRELTARVKAVLKRTAKPVATSDTIDIGDYVRINPQKYEVSVEGKKLDLTATEFRILHLLASKQGWVFSRDRILTHLWGSDKMVIDRTIDVHIKHLREKMGTAGTLIKNMRGIGYKLEIGD